MNKRIKKKKNTRKHFDNFRKINLYEYDLINKKKFKAEIKMCFLQITHC